MKFSEVLCAQSKQAAASEGFDAASMLRLMSPRSIPGTNPEGQLRSQFSPPRDSGKDGVVREVPNEFTRATAYFSQRPPALPMQIIAVTPRAISEAEDMCKKAVRSVLCELVAALPLSPPQSPPQSPPLSPGPRTRSQDAARSPRPARVQHARRRMRRTRQTAPASSAPPLQKAPNAFGARGHNRNIVPLDDSIQSAGTMVSDVRTTSAGSADSVCSACSADSASSAGSEERVWPRSAGSAERAWPLSAGIEERAWTRSAGSAERAWPRSVATQVHDQGCIHRDDWNPDEWLGGMRALRDSHVRLVLRQLRHIERLNRALDRSASPATPPGASRDVRAQRSPHTPFLTH